MSNALDNVAKLRPIFNVREPRFGAKGDNLTDDTAALQAAIDAAEVAGGCVEIPPGTYLHTGLTIGDNITLRGWEQTTCVLKLKPASNASSITIAPISQCPVIENLTIEGNRSGNLTSGHGIELEDDPGGSYGFGVVLRNVYIQNVRETCLHIGSNRNMGDVINSEFKRGGMGCYINGASDWRFHHGRFAFPLTSYALHMVSGADNVFTSCTFFGATLAACVLIDTAGSSPTKLIGCTINANEFDGLHIKGFSGAARTVGHQVIGCWFESNGLAAASTYSDIVLEDTRDTVLIGNTFRWPGTVNRPAYLVEFTGASTRAQWVGNSYDDSVNIPYGVALSNFPQNLHTRAQALYSDSACYLGGAGDAYSLNVQAGVAGGNAVQIQGRAAGSPVTIQAIGEANAGLRVSSNGTGAVEVMTGGLGRRVARFLNVASSVNYLDFYPSVANSPVLMAAAGADTDIDVQVFPKGSGNFMLPLANVPDAADDAAAATASVPVGGFYRTGSALKIRAA